MIEQVEGGVIDSYLFLRKCIEGILIDKLQDGRLNMSA
jgi:hypothetical protein